MGSEQPEGQRLAAGHWGCQRALCPLCEPLSREPVQLTFSPGAMPSSHWFQTDSDLPLGSSLRTATDLALNAQYCV